MLALEGLDDDKNGATQMAVAVNGRPLWRGGNCFPEDLWGRMGFTLPADALKKGVNRITIANITPDQPSRSAEFADDPVKGAADPRWGWFRIAEAVILDPAGDFERAKAGDRKQPWRSGMRRAKDSVCGKAAFGGGKVELTSTGEGYGLAYCAFGKDARNAMIAAAPGSRIRFAVEAAGEGKLLLRMMNYRPQPGLPGKPQIPLRGICGRTATLKASNAEPAALAAEPRTFRAEFVVPEKGGLVIPRVELAGPGRAALTRVSLEVLPPER